MLYLWEWFHELEGARQGNGMGMNLISHQEIESWARQSHRHVSSWELGVLKSIDVLCVTTASNK